MGYNDSSGDTLELLAALGIADVGGDNVRIPPEGAEVIGDTFAGGAMIGDDDGICEPNEVCFGNLPIVAVVGNTTCTIGGSLPCLIGSVHSTLSGLPGDAQPGLVRFHQDTYVVQSDDPDVIALRTVIVWQDLCDDPATNGCGFGVINSAQAPAAAQVPSCDDASPCTVDSCGEGECMFMPDCTEQDLSACENNDVCTTDICGVDGCCVNTLLCVMAADCDDGDVCTTNTCGGDGCCINTPLCTTAEDCNDDDVCTTDTCGTDGCCTNDPLRCDDGDECTEDRCDPQLGCTSTPIDPPPAGCGGCPVIGDVDDDCDIDLVDTAGFLRCFGESPLSLGCNAVDFDGNSTVDAQDWSMFAILLNGPGIQ